MTAAGLALLSVVLVTASPAHAQIVNWNHTELAPVNGAMPSIAVDRLGYVHVGWTLDTGGSSYWAYHVGNQSGQYALTLVDSRTTGTPEPIFPFLSTDSLGYFHMAWREMGLTGKPIFYRTSNPETRALVRKNFHSSGHTHDPIIDVTSDDVAHIITEADSCTGCASGSNLYDEGFTATTTTAGRVFSLVQDPNDTTGVQQFSSTVSPDDTRHLVFSARLAPPQDNQRLIYYTSRAPGSATWAVPVSITGHEDNGQGWPAIVSDSGGSLHVMYSSGDYGIYYVNKRGGTWSVPLRINDQNEVTDAIPSVAIDPNGRLHVVFQRYTPVPGSAAKVSIHYTTNAYDPDNWLDPASEILGGLPLNATPVTHQNRKVAVNWVDGEVLVPYHAGNTMWMASTTDVPVTPLDPGGTTTLVPHSGFTSPMQLSRAVSNTATTATTVLKFDVVDNGGDGKATRIVQLHVNAGPAQSFPRVLGKDEGLSYLLGGAQLVTGSGQVIPGVLSERKIVFRDTAQAMAVANGATQTFELQIWLKNQPYVTGQTIELRIKPDQDVVVERAGASSVMTTDQVVVSTNGMVVIDGAVSCLSGASCNDGNPCTHDDRCNGSGVCQGTPLTCTSTACQTLTCNGTATCAVAPRTGMACDDGNACTHGDLCDVAGTCAGAPLTCVSDACVARSCNGSASCTVTPKTGMTCDDGNACTHGDVCNAAGVCSGPTITCISDGCATRACNGSATCTVTPKTGAVCDDGDTCTHGDVCNAAGACAGAALTCVSDVCVSRTCNGSATCTVTPQTGATCDDGNPCTHTDLCTNTGTCAGSSLTCSDDTCYTRTCNGTSACQVTAKPGPSCTEVDECAAGTHNCASKAVCTNTAGSFTCACQAGYTGDGVTCVAVPDGGSDKPMPGSSSGGGGGGCAISGDGSRDDSEGLPTLGLALLALGAAAFRRRPRAVVS